MSVDWILTHRLRGLTEKDRRLRAAEALHAHVEHMRQHLDLHHDRDHPSTRVRRVVRLHGTPEIADRLRDTLHRHVIFERAVRYETHESMKFLGGRRPVREFHAAETAEHALDVTVTGSGSPLSGAEVVLQVLRDKTPRLLEPVETDATGRAFVPFDATDTPLVVAAYPHAGFWSTALRSPSGSVSIDCAPLPTTGATAWWHRAMGLDGSDDDAGRGIVVGVIGTGCSPHPCLEHVERLDGAEDVSSHGTMVCGVIGARPVREGQLRGLAPGARVVTLRVFEKENGSISHPHQGDLAQAIDRMIHPEVDGPVVDVINMSLGAGHAIGLHDAVVNAMDQGTICVCSAGNSASSVEYPAALDETVGVSALGQVDWGPEDSTAVLWMPDASAMPERFAGDGTYFVPLFSCHGAELACTAPGDGVISTVPPTDAFPDGYASMDGTSLSSPAAAALLAALLSENEAWKAMPRDRARADAARSLLDAHCADLGLRPDYQGAGMPARQPGRPARPILPSRPSSRPSPRSGAKPGITRT